ncbi:NRDE family protein [Candidimonas sp. SYP-B2681]|uniref:NRDE family protein n=1 Tax=Candidimonas sp. SYP-B2681 TaxID=2497686 RepID=UPI000F85F686|nr:NRDE family protein [Candidimonas sp. SYP-B2681]RTZ39221.1 NRDE family protein [Candidimonas sp. SYP-B2681]
MCIAYLALNAHKEWPLFIAANRDEYHSRPSLTAAPWQDHPDVIAGIDCQGKGTWLGITRQGRYALLTNYRDPATLIKDAPSRGDLARQYLTSDKQPDSYAQDVFDASNAYNGFNLIVGDLTTASYVGNRTDQDGPQALGPGRYVISNHLLNTPWPKAERLRLALDLYPLETLEQSLTHVFETLKDNTQAEDHALPVTGLTLERERLLSSPFIISPEYGTRCSTVIAVHASGRAIFSETSYNASGSATERHDWPFSIERPNGR